MEAPYTYRVTVTIECTDRDCPAKESIGYFVYHGRSIPIPSVPDGWHVFDGWPYCGKHTIEVKPKLD